MLKLIALIFAALVAHPYESVFITWLALNIANGVLPARVRTGPVGAALHTLIDRLAVTMRSDAPGTLKWPGIASAIVGRPIARDVVDVSGPSIDDVRDRPTRLPPPGPGLGVLLVALAWLALLQLGCAGPMVQSAPAQMAVRVAWPSVHKGAVSAGLCDDDPPQWLVGPTPHKDLDAGAPAPSAEAGDASVPATAVDAAAQPPDAGAGQ